MGHIIYVINGIFKSILFMLVGFFSTQTKYSYTSTTTSTIVNYYYKYFKNYKIKSGTYSSVYKFNDYFTTQAKTAQYKIVDRT